MGKKVLIIGSGGREHALSWKLAQSPKIKQIFIAPGNLGTAEFGQNIDIQATDIEQLADFAARENVNLTVVGPDEPLSLGIVDYFQSKKLRIFGPTKAAAEIEWSKRFAKELMQSANIPTANYKIFDTYDKAQATIKNHPLPLVIKASGLALGKGVYLCHSQTEAEAALRALMVDRVHGKAGDKVIIEDFLDGPELSLHAVSDGQSSVLFPASQDHKAIFDHDRGPNTGGMGSIAPVPWVGETLLNQTQKMIINPTLGSLAAAGRPFAGCLFPGLKITDNGPRVLEFNARFGDPETQVYMRLLKSDLYELLLACVEGNLVHHQIAWQPGVAVCIVLAAQGYPGKYQTDLPITGFKQAAALPGIQLFQAGTKIKNNQLVTAGGRVLGVSAVGSTLQAALDLAYRAVELIDFPGKQYRRDIGAKSLVVAQL